MNTNPEKMINMYENEVGSASGIEDKNSGSASSQFDQITNSLGLGNSEDAVRKLVARAKDNPVPMALIGTGLAWLLWPKPSSETKARAQNLRAAAENHMVAVKGSAIEVGESFVDTASELGAEIASSATRIGDKAVSKASLASDSAKEVCSSARSQLGETVDSQPVVAALGALVVGMIAGAIPKSTRVENNLVGDYSDRVKNGIRAEAKSAVARSKSVVKDTVSHAVDELEESGLTFQGIREKVEEVAANVKNEAIANAKSGLEDTADSVAEEANAVKKSTVG